jgi:hypothetical protein
VAAASAANVAVAAASAAFELSLNRDNSTCTPVRNATPRTNETPDDKHG